MMTERVASVGDAILNLGDTPERREVVNAYERDMLDLKALIVNRFDQLEATGKQRGVLMSTIDADIKLTLNRMHHMSGMVQGLIVKIDDQALYSSLLDERLAIVESDQTTIKSDLAQIKETLGKLGL